MRELIFLHLLLLLVAVQAQNEDCWKVERINTRRGSVAGRTKIVIPGNCYDRTVDDPPMNIYLVSDKITYECDIELVENSATIVTCITRAMNSGTYQIRMTMNNVALSLDKYCNGNANSWWCTFYVWYGRTPTITGIDIRGSEPDQMISIDGRIYTNKSAAGELSLNDNEASIRAVEMGPPCRLYDTDANKYGISLTSDTSTSGTITCKIPEANIGYKNVSYYLDSEYGSSLQGPSLYHVGANNQLYMLQTYAVVTDVNPKLGSVNGGTLLTITGRHFVHNVDFYPAKVLVGGQECAVQSADSETITCLTPKRPEVQPIYGGGRGVLVEVFPGVTDIEATLNSSAADVWSFWVDHASPETADFVENQDNYVSRAQFFFLPPITGDYYFYGKAAQEMLVYMSTTGSDPADKVEILRASGSTGYSVRYPLTKGVEYYMEVRHLKATSAENFQLSAFSDASSFTPEDTSAAQTERQTIKISSTVIKEVQTIEFRNWSPQETSLPSTWKLSCSGNCQGEAFAFRLFETTSDPLVYDTLSDYSLKAAIEMIPALDSAHDQVTVESQGSDYIITVTTTRGKMPFELHTIANTTELNLVEEAPTGTGDLSTFTILINGKVSDPVPVASAENSIAEAVKSLFGPKCPSDIERNIGTREASYSGYEDDTVPITGEKSIENPYCGTYSLKNPWVLYESSIGYSFKQYQHVCFAYLGDISSSVSVVFAQPSDNDESSFVTTTVSKTVPALQTGSSDSWNHVCFDLSDLWETDSDEVSYSAVRRITIGAGSDSNKDLYIDNFFIGYTSATDDELQRRRQRIIPSAVPHIQLESINVVKTNDTYELTFLPFNCGHDFPLIGFAFAESSSDVEGGQNYNFGDAEIIVLRNGTASPPVEGTFDISFENSTFRSLTGLPADIEAKDLKNVLESLLEIDSVTVQREDDCTGYKWTVYFTRPAGKYPSMVVDSSSLTSSPENAEVEVKTVVEGGMKLDPIFGDFTRTAHSIPQVQVFINETLSHNDGTTDNSTTTSCQFEWDDSATPVLNSIAPVTASPGGEVTIEGTGLSSEVTVSIGGVSCEVQTSTETEITCTLGSSPAGQQDVLATGNVMGTASIGDAFGTTFTVSGSVTAISLTSGSSMGCTSVTITGSGFSKETAVLIGGEPCDVTESNYDKIVCSTPAGNAGEAEVSVVQSMLELNTGAGAVTFSYTAPSAEVTEVSAASSLSAAGGETITISGTNFGTDEGEVRFDTNSVEVTSWSDTEIVVTSPALKSGSYAVKVLIPIIGCAISTSTVSYQFTVTEFSPKTGSRTGGTVVRVDGAGLSDKVDIQFGPIHCEVTNVADDGSYLECVTQSLATTHTVSNTGTHPVLGDKYEWNPKTLVITEGDSVDFVWNYLLVSVAEKRGFHSTTNATTTEYDGEGFKQGYSFSGKRTVEFPTTGLNYYSNDGCFFDDCEDEMRGTIEVQEMSAHAHSIKATLDEVEATVETEDVFTISTGTVSRVASISPNEGTTETEIVITGTNFDASAVVTVGGKACVSSQMTAEEITCKISASEELTTGVMHPVLVRTTFGNAAIDIKKEELGQFLLKPLMTSVSPIEGSTQGGTILTIQGSGFTDKSVIHVGDVACEVTSVSYIEIVCQIAAIPAGSGEVKHEVKFSSDNEADSNHICSDDAPCEFEYKDSLTPEVTEVVDNENFDDRKLTFRGTGFSTENTELTVKLTASWNLEVACTASAASAVEFQCAMDSVFGLGVNVISLHVAGKGFAKFQESTGTLNNLQRIRGSIGLVSSRNTDAAEAILTAIDCMSRGGGAKVKFLLSGAPEDISQLNVTMVNKDDETVSLEVTEFQYESDVLEITTPPVTAYGAYHLEIAGFTCPDDCTELRYSSTCDPTMTALDPNSGKAGDLLTITVTGLGETTIVEAVEIGTYLCTDVTPADENGVITCKIPEGIGSHQVKVLTDRGYAITTASSSSPTSRKRRTTDNDVFSFVVGIAVIDPKRGSFGGGQEVCAEGWGFTVDVVAVTLCSEPCRITSQIYTRICCETPAQVSEDAEMECEFKVQYPSTDLYFPYTGTEAEGDVYTHQQDLTPMITAVSPATGGTGGGTTITVAGMNFQSADVDKVKIGGADCESLVVSSETELTCITGESQLTGSFEVELISSTNGKSKPTAEAVEFFYIDRWSSPYTWNNLKPEEDDFVVIKENQTVLLDESPPCLSTILINGGTLIFDRKDGLKLCAQYIFINNNGTLQIGTEEEPFTQTVTIELNAHLRSRELPIYGANVLAVRSGRLDLHGSPVWTWTRLAATAEAGSNQIEVEKPVGWQVGNEIVIASTGLRHSQRQNEQRTIEEVQWNEDLGTTTIKLTEPLEYKHLGVKETISGREIEFRAEVGLLTRNIVFRGWNDEQWNDKIEDCKAGFNTGQFATQTCFQGRFGEEVGTNEYGATIMMHHSVADSKVAQAYIEFVELTFVGQAFRLGRYPIHFHLMGNVSGMYVRGCAIHKSFNRAVTIHGTHNLLVENNVVYDIMGGAIFIEDGIETKNTIQYNLAVFVKQSTSLLNDDITPASYWVTNPDNTIRHNHAAGGTHFGFWYRMHEHPDGPSFTQSVCQQKVPLLEFYNNTVHSQGWFGLWIFQSYFPTDDVSCHSNVPLPAKFRGLTTWNSEKGAEWVNCGAIQFIDFVLVNNEVAGLDLKLVKNTEWGETRGAMVKDSLIVGHSELLEENSQKAFAILIPLSPKLTIDNVAFVNYNRDSSTVFGLTAIQGVCTTLCGGFKTIVSRATFENVNRMTEFGWEHAIDLYSPDGSIDPSSSNSPVHAVVTVNALPDTCRVQEGEMFSSNTDFPVSICPGSTGFVRYAVKNPLPSSLEAKDLVMTNSHGNTSSPFLKKRITHKPGWMFLLPTNELYDMKFTDENIFTNISWQSEVSEIEPNEYIRIRLSLPTKPDFVVINDNHPSQPEEIESTSSLGTENYNWNYFLDSDNDSSVTFHLSNDNGGEGPMDIQFNPNIYSCYFEYCREPLDIATITSPDIFDVSYATLLFGDDDGCIVEDGKTMTVLKKSKGVPCWKIVDRAELVFDTIIVEGVLHFHNMSTNVTCTHLIVKGRLLARTIGSEYFEHDLQINLVRKPDSELVILEGVAVGMEAMACFGGCDFHGKPHDVYWTRLQNTAMPTATEIVLEKEVDWKAGDTIVVTTTGYRAEETEKRVIESIVDGKIVTLTEALEHRHLGAAYANDYLTYQMRAEVGLLTRNIKIIGQEVPVEDEGDFQGGRVLVVNDNSFGRFSNVEFQYTGQEGFNHEWDPRFSLAFLDTGTVSDLRPSYVKGCSFHDGFWTAIGAFGTHNLTVENNVVQSCIYDGVRLTGSYHVVKHNLVSRALYKGSIGDREELNDFLADNWHAAFDVKETKNLTLIGNVAAGSERLGFHISGEDCNNINAEGWQNNTAHGCLHGVHILYSGFGTCSLIRNFYIYKSWDFGIYIQSPDSQIIQGNTVIDSTVGVMPISYGPSALSHAYQNKYIELNSFSCVGKSEDFDPQYDFMDEANDKALRIRRLAGPSKAAPRPGAGATSCIVLGHFASGTTGSTFKPFNNEKTYPAIRGHFIIRNLIAMKYKTVDGARSLVLFQNPRVEDATHPTSIYGAQLVDVDEENKLRIEQPSLGKVNPSDCVDMECDAKKKILIQDFNGNFFRDSDRSEVFSRSEWEWDGDIRRGIGDYRVPKTLLTAPNGDRLATEVIYDEKGIVRSDSNCTLNEHWQAYNCPRSSSQALDHRMLVIESLDDDTESRRLSPVAVVIDKYIDLLNGPQDHGWCFGYTCQKRISTFYSIVAINKEVHIHFTGYAPKKLRFHLLNADKDDTVMISVWYARPEKLDVVLQDNTVVEAIESNLNFDMQNGANYMDESTRNLHVLLRGPDHLTINTTASIYISFNVYVTVDEFFGENIVNNFARFFGIDPTKIKVVNVVSEQTQFSRKRRSTTNVQSRVTLEYSETEGSDGQTATEKVNTVSSRVVRLAQTNQLASALSLSEVGQVSATTYSEEVPPGEAEYESEVIFNPPASLKNEQATNTIEEYLGFSVILVLLDDQGERIATMNDDFQARVVMRTTQGVVSELLGSSTATFVNGTALFFNLKVRSVGSYILTFEIIVPENVSLSLAVPLTVTERTVNALFTNSAPNYIYHNSHIDLEVELRNSIGLPLEDPGHRGYTWKMEVGLDNPSHYPSITLGTQTVFDFDPSTGKVMTTGLQLLNTNSFNSYNLLCRVYTEPQHYEMTLLSDSITFVYEQELTGDSAIFTVIRDIGMVLSGQPHLGRSTSSSLDSFTTALRNEIVNLQNSSLARINSLVSSVTVDGNTSVSFGIRAVTEDEAENVIGGLSRLFDNSLPGLSSYPISMADASCGIMVDSVCRTVVITTTPLSNATTIVQPVLASEEEPGVPNWVFIVVGCVIALLLAVILITLSCIMKRAKLNKVGLTHGVVCMDANSSRGSSPLIDSLYNGTVSTTDAATTPGGGHSVVGNRVSPLPTVGSMTPVET